MRNDVMLSEALRAAGADARKLERGEALQIAFYCWVMNEGEQRRPQLEAQTQEVCADVVGSGRSIQSVAALGYLISIPEATTDDDKECRVFAEGLQWLMGRTATSQAAFAALLQPVAQLGLLCGVITRNDEALFGKFSRWFSQLLSRKGSDGGRNTEWREDLLVSIAARVRAGLRGQAVLPMGVGAVVLASRGIAVIEATEASAFHAQLLARLKGLDYADAEEAAMHVAAYRYLARCDVPVDLRSASVDDVGLILAQLPAALRRWTWEDQKKTPNSNAQKWRIENEYHFQNLVYLVLAPIFRDLRDEEWLASV